jgi:hypothetical protein
VIVWFKKDTLKSVEYQLFKFSQKSLPAITGRLKISMDAEALANATGLAEPVVLAVV